MSNDKKSTEVKPTAVKTPAKKVGESAKQEPVVEQKPAGATNTKPTEAEKAEAKRIKDEAAKQKKAEADKAKADKKAENDKKRADAKAAKLKEKEAARKPHEGVIYHIALMIGRKEGASKKEILDHLESTFKDRERDKMEVTVGIQLTRLPKTLNFELARDKSDEARGLVYKAPSDVIKMVADRSIRAKGGEPVATA